MDLSNWAVPRAYLTYCIETWGNAPKTTLEPITILQKRAIRLLNCADYYAHTNPLFTKNQILKFTDLVDLNTSLVVFKARNHLLPANIQCLFNERDNLCALRRELNLKQKNWRLVLKSRCISVCGVKLWNEQPITLQQSKNVAQFKKRFKNLTLERYKRES